MPTVEITKYVAYDEKGDATEAINAYNKLVSNDKVVALIGDVTSSPAWRSRSRRRRTTCR